MRNDAAPVISDNFTMQDIRAIRDCSSQKHCNMTHQEIIADTKKGADEFLAYLQSKKSDLINQC